MPFTLAHPAVAWPIRRLWPRVPLAALAIGAVSPDFEYFLYMAPTGRFTHSALGVATICVPTSIVAWAVYRRFVRPGLMYLLPTGLAAIMRNEPVGAVAVVTAVLLGTVTHVVWDGFTHPTGWAVVAWPLLRHHPAPTIAPGVAWFKVLQHASSAIGLGALAVWGATWVRSQSSEARRFNPQERRRVVGVSAFVVVAAVAVAAANALRVTRPASATAVGYAGIGALVGGLSAVVGVGVWATAAAWQSNLHPTASGDHSVPRVKRGR